MSCTLAPWKPLRRMTFSAASMGWPRSACDSGLRGVSVTVSSATAGTRAGYRWALRSAVRREQAGGPASTEQVVVHGPVVIPDGHLLGPVEPVPVIGHRMETGG